MKAEIKKKRVALLLRITELEAERCEHCGGPYMNKETLNCSCAAATEIRKLGDEMETLVSKRRSAGIREERKSYNPKMIQLAIDNQIGYKDFWQRVNRYGWSQERAATEPLHSKRVRK